MQPRWRDTLKVHPAADVFPLLPKNELRELADDIRTFGGLHEGVTLFLDTPSSDPVLLDGRNRLDALELLGSPIFDAKGEVRKEWYDSTLWPGHDPVAYVISANIRRRHLTRRQQACLIVEAVKAGQIDRAKVARSIGGSPKGQKGGGGSTKDPIKAQVIELAAKQGISARTATQALVDAEPERKRPSPKLEAKKGDRPMTIPELEEEVVMSLNPLAAAFAMAGGHGGVTITADVRFADGTVFWKSVRR